MLNSDKRWVIISFENLNHTTIGGLRASRLNSFLNEKKINSTLISREKVNKNEIEIKDFFLFKFINKLINYFFFDYTLIWCFKVKKHLLKEKKIILFTTSPPHGVHLVGYLLKRINRHDIHWIADFRDSYTLNELYRPFLTKRLIDRKFEKLIFKIADQLVFNSKTYLNSYIAKNPLIKNKSVYIRNGFDKNVICDKKKKWFEFIYSGGNYKGEVVEGIGDFFYAMSNLKIELNFTCDFLGENHPSISKNNMFNYLGKVEQKNVSQIISNYVFGLVYLPKRNINSGRIAQKFYDYIGAGVIPVCINPTIEMTAIMKKLKIGISIYEETHMEFVMSELVRQSDSVEFNANSVKEFSREDQFDRLLKKVSY